MGATRFQAGLVQSVLGLSVLLTTILVAGGVTLFLYGWAGWTGKGPLTAEKSVIIEKGEGVSAIAATLSDNGVIADKTLFRAMTQITGHHTGLKAGEYLFPAGITMRDAVTMMSDGAVVQRRVTVPEGLTSHQVIELLRRTEGMSGTMAMIPAEGSLLPETYNFTKDQDRGTLITEMQGAMKETLDELWPGRDSDLPFSTIEEAVTLASIVEKETGVAAERPHIAQVFINRLRKGMPLQSDPTVIYAITRGKIQDEGQGPLGRRLLRKDLQDTKSPYNTYLNAGLPPGPIANPGRAAIEAVLHPAPGDDLYFVADGTGGHVFAKTLAEHEANVVKWRQIRKERGE